MRFKSKVQGGYQVFAVSGTNTISFAIDPRSANTKGLLGFAVERIDPTENEQFFAFGFKVFPSIIPEPDEKTTVRTSDHPVQSFLWDDFTGKPDRPYTYIFHPLKGTPKNLDRSATPIEIEVRTEPLFSTFAHDIFFNRGVASSQAYTRKFGNQSPGQLDKTSPKKAAEARQWLSRDLDEAMLKFIANARKGDTLLCCFYEFRYRPVAQALRDAIKRKVDVQLIVDAKNNGTKKTKTKKAKAPFPRQDNLALIKDVGIPSERVIRREAKKSNIQHNKFMVLLKGKSKAPAEVWTGSTNVSDGGIHGQTNVGHWVRDKNVAARFKDYWEVLSDDPGGTEKDDRSTANKKNAAFRKSVEGINAVPKAWKDFGKGITTVFSPRSGPGVLNMYAAMVDEADDVSCITLAFGISAAFKNVLSDNSKKSHIGFFLLEKEDKPNPRAKGPFVKLNATNNIYKAWGSFLDEPLYQWARETNAKFLQLNNHVSYIHSKFLLADPLSKNPIVVTGSANFSKASTNDNDENMLVIRGDQRVADIYFTEFNRLFYHYYFRSVQEATERVLSEDEKRKQDEQTLFLAENDSWLKKYKPGTLRQKRLGIFTTMDGFAKP